ncbi:hypothetical protein [Erythrobacter sp. NAP1]|uniref:hypothetical protein n=1 Tax=Erythrobacter sp. NAP1 TaxID=237727 RepID=UPI00030D1C27|nr:hypothetical protein [Erythrobacter sp. NAP1]
MISDPELREYYEGPPGGQRVAASGTLISFGKNGSLIFGGALILWLFLYVSTIFPYLGQAQQSQMSGAGFNVSGGVSNFGTQRMFLVAGQTAFFEYDVKGDEDAGVRFDLHAWPNAAFSDQSQTITGTQSGRAEFVVEKTGFYSFYHDFSTNAPGSKTSYSVSWGAE